METINIILQAKHFRESKTFVTQCPISLALKEKFKIDNLIIGTSDIFLNKDHYSIVSCLSVKEFNNLIKNAKQKKKVGNHVLTLIKNN